MVADYSCRCGEGPLWHPDEQRLYWVDIPLGRIFRYDPVSGAHEQCHEGEPIGGFTIQSDGALLLFMGGGVVKRWREGQLTEVLGEIPQEHDSRFNDVIADPVGRVFCGTLATGRPGKLYRLDTDGTLSVVMEGVPGANGMAFTPDRKQMYFTDSRDHAIYVFDYDLDSGALANRRVFAPVPEEAGSPDGMTVDAEGYVWSARWGGSCLARYAPDGTEERRVHFPAKKVSSLVFGGRDYTDIYVTTAGGHNRAEDGEGAGALFRVNVGIRGVAEFRSRVGL